MIGVKYAEFIFNFFGAKTLHDQLFAATSRACFWQLGLVATIMAFEVILPLVVSQAHIAVDALTGPITGAAFVDRRVTPAVLKQDDLFAHLNRFLYGPCQSW